MALSSTNKKQELLLNVWPVGSAIGARIGPKASSRKRSFQVWKCVLLEGQFVPTCLGLYPKTLVVWGRSWVGRCAILHPIGVGVGVAVETAKPFEERNGEGDDWLVVVA